MMTNGGGEGSARTAAMGRTPKSRSAEKMERMRIFLLEMRGRLHEEGAPGSLECVERLAVVQGRAEPGGSVHVVAFELQEPMGIDVEAQGAGHVVHRTGRARSAVDVREVERIVSAGLKPATDA